MVHVEVQPYPQDICISSSLTALASALAQLVFSLLTVTQDAHVNVIYCDSKLSPHITDCNSTTEFFVRVNT